MTLYVAVIRELRLRFTVDPGPGTRRHIRALSWSGEAPNEHEARREAIAAWSRTHGEAPRPPFELEIRPE